MSTSVHFMYDLRPSKDGSISRTEHDNIHVMGKLRLLQLTKLL